MNNNYNNISFDYIGAIGTHTITDYIDINSNILNDKIDIRSNILNNKIDTTSNILKLYTDTNITNLDNKYNELINQKTEIETYLGINYNVKHTYINNSNLDNPFSEIRFYSKNAINYPTYEITASPIYKVKIGNDGKLYLWYSYNPFISLTLTSQWVDLNQEIGKQQADGLNQGSAIVALENQIILINSTITAISGELTSLYGLSSGSSGYGGLSGSAYNVPRLDNGIITNVEIDSIRNNLITRAQTVQNYITNLGGATGVLSFIYGIVEAEQRSRYTNTLIDQLRSNLNSNIAIGNTQNANIISNTMIYTSNNYLTSNLKDIYDNYSNISLLQGFINCNIQTQQTISNIFTSNITAVYANINNIYNKTETNNLLNAKDSILTFTSPLVRTTNNITFNEASITTLTNFYNKTETNNLLNAKDSILTFASPLVRTTNNITFNQASITTLTNFYNKTETNNLLNAKDSILTFASPLVRTTNNITFNEASITTLTNFYNKTNSDGRYLQLTGGSMTGQITGITTLNGTTGIFGTIATTNNTNQAIPSVGVAGGVGDKYIIQSGTVSTYPYSIGFETNSLWISSPNTIKLYNNGTNSILINSSGNVGIGTTPSHKLHIDSGCLYITGNISNPGNNTSASLWNQTGIGPTFSGYQFVVQTNGTTERMRIDGSGNVGIGTNNPNALLDVRGNIDCSGGIAINGSTAFYFVADIVDAGNKINTYINFKEAGTNSDWCYLRQIGGTNTYKLSLDFHDDGNDARFCIRNITSTTNPDGIKEVFTVDNGNITCTGNIYMGTDNNYANIWLGSVNGNNIAISNPGGFSTSAALGDMVIRSLNRLILQSGGGSAAFIIDTANNTTVNALTLTNAIYLKTDLWNYSTDSKERFWFATNGTTYYRGHGNASIFSVNHEWRNHDNVQKMTLDYQGNLIVHSYINCKLLTVAYDPHDFVGIAVNGTTLNSSGNYTLYVILNSFTGFHRCFTDDELFDINEIQKFKEDYVGRIVISTGKIKTHIPSNPGEWEIKENKEGILIEDAHPIIELSRTKKDKRVFGVLGEPKRNNSITERLIVNSVGEGGLWVCNSNGNIENGDYITSSDYLGYGEKQDEIYLCNFTVAKATMDCNFELDSPLYECKEIDYEGREGLRVAFIAVSYHCG